MRVLFVANAGWASTGYGIQVKGLLPYLVEQGHDIAVFAFWGLEGGKVDLPLDGGDGRVLTHYPRLADPYGNDIVADHARDFGADCVITLMDAWVCDPRVYQPLNWLAWTPIDQEPIPELVVARLPHMKRVLPYSRWGEGLIRKLGCPCTYIPHGVDTKVFKPLDAQARVRAKEAFGFEPDTFLVGMVGANKGFPARKGFPEAFQAFALLREKVPQARLYCHSQIASTWGGPNLMQLAEMCGIAPYVRFPDQYQLAVGLPQEALALAYNAMDVLLQSSTHEGFGLPMLEAQACGTPVVAVDYASMSELVAPQYGAIRKPLQKQLTTLMSWAAVPDVQALARALHEVAEEPPGKAERQVLRKFAERYAWPLVAEHYWRPLLDSVAEELGAPSSHDKALHDAVYAARDAEDRQVFLEGDRHGCCCGHVVNQLEAMPGPAEEIANVGRDKLANCPHREVANELEIWVECLVSETLPA